MIAADLDVERLLHERSRNMTFGESRGENYQLTELGPPPPLESVQRRIERRPFVPSDRLPGGRKVGSVTLSPRGDLRMHDEVSPRRLLASWEVT